MTPLTQEQREELGRLLQKTGDGIDPWHAQKFDVADDNGQHVCEFASNERDDDWGDELDCLRAELTAKAKNALPALLASAARESRLERALENIIRLDYGSERETARGARLIARAALNGETAK